MQFKSIFVLALPVVSVLAAPMHTGNGLEARQDSTLAAFKKPAPKPKPAPAPAPKPAPVPAPKPSPVPSPKASAPAPSSPPPKATNPATKPTSAAGQPTTAAGQPATGTAQPTAAPRAGGGAMVPVTDAQPMGTGGIRATIKAAVAGEISTHISTGMAAAMKLVTDIADWTRAREEFTKATVKALWDGNTDPAAYNGAVCYNGAFKVDKPDGIAGQTSVDLVKGALKTNYNCFYMMPGNIFRAEGDGGYINLATAGNCKLQGKILTC